MDRKEETKRPVPQAATFPILYSLVSTLNRVQSTGTISPRERAQPLGTQPYLKNSELYIILDAFDAAAAERLAADLDRGGAFDDVA